MNLSSLGLFSAAFLAVVIGGAMAAREAKDDERARKEAPCETFGHLPEREVPWRCIVAARREDP